MLNKFKDLESYNGFQVGELMIYIRPISYRQQEFLISNYEEFIGDPKSFYEILTDIIINKEVLEKIECDEYMIFSLIAVICMKQDVSIEYDYYLSKILVNFEKYYNHIINKYVEALLLFGYKYSEIKKMTQNEIMECAIYETGMRSLPDLIKFLCVDLGEQNVKSIEIVNRLSEKLEEISKSVPGKKKNDAYDQLMNL